ncbi:hypothetical protein GCM10017562_65110 [Streptomyces roseofulvus]|uniref:DegT/DnrJ/EryC1/StrS family aminotransferase n=1 Tax=Streptomyces roseofulvus TaxID=33902 RepID=UPI0031FDCBE0
MIPAVYEEDGGDTRYNPLPARVRVPLCPAPRPTIGFLRRLAALGGDPTRTDRAVRIALGRRLGVDPARVLLTESGSHALVTALRMLRRNPQDEVVVPAFSCPSLVAAVLAAGMVPVLCDLDEDWAMGPEQVSPVLSASTRVVIAAHIFGTPADLPGLQELCDARGIDLVDDAAQALGGVVAGRPMGSWGRCGVLSFGRHKPLFAGGGGALVLDERAAEVLAEPLPQRARRGAGWDSLLHAARMDALRRLDTRLPVRLRLQPAPVEDARVPLEHYQLADAGAAGMPAVHGALLLDQLSRLDQDRSRVRAAAARYTSALSPALLPPPDAVLAGELNFVPLVCAPADRRSIAAHFASLGVETTWLYYPMHRVRQYRGRVRVGRLQVSDALWKSVLCVPGRGRHTDEQIRQVAHAIRTAHPVPGRTAMGGQTTEGPHARHRQQ